MATTTGVAAVQQSSGKTATTRMFANGVVSLAKTWWINRHLRDASLGIKHHGAMSLHLLPISATRKQFQPVVTRVMAIIQASKVIFSSCTLVFCTNSRRNLQFPLDAGNICKDDCGRKIYWFVKDTRELYKPCLLISMKEIIVKGKCWFQAFA